MQLQLVHAVLHSCEILTTKAVYLVEPAHFGVSSAKQRLRELEHICRISDNTVLHKKLLIGEIRGLVAQVLTFQWRLSNHRESSGTLPKALGNAMSLAKGLNVGIHAGSFGICLCRLSLESAMQIMVEQSMSSVQQQVDVWL